MKYFSSGQSLKSNPSAAHVSAIDSCSRTSSCATSSVIQTAEADIPPASFKCWTRWSRIWAGSPARIIKPLLCASKLCFKSQTACAKNRARCGPHRQNLPTSLRAGSNGFCSPFFNRPDNSIWLCGKTKTGKRCVNPWSVVDARWWRMALSATRKSRLNKYTRSLLAVMTLKVGRLEGVRVVYDNLWRLLWLWSRNTGLGGGRRTRKAQRARANNS